MQYLNNTFWRMIIGFLAVIIVALGLLYLSISYDRQGTDVPVENYLAGSDSETGD
jgi:anti-sigma-K factor RskA